MPLASGAPLPTDPPDDEQFLRSLAAELASRYCVDRRSVYAAGYSGGGRMVSSLACDAADVIAAVGAVGGLRSPDPCASSRPISVIGFHGTADPVNPYNGSGDEVWGYGVREAAERWATFDRCGPVRPSRAAPSVELRRYRACKGGASVELYTLEGFGHQWPGGPSQPADVSARLGPASAAIDASELLWSFFREHPLPGAARR